MIDDSVRLPFREQEAFRRRDILPLPEHRHLRTVLTIAYHLSICTHGLSRGKTGIGMG